ncbi:MAG: hypothetical protein AVDCRST_MAG83-1733 [uncultured Arthrobacter sp.]|uniref:Uncharacterized protein n=2 Tax=uncultured Arthrobacter sp. TaxID=114050 RepID=A0A6J4I5F2_9MICC|nr:MAG: hypothetical protein AVDCRST_MAG83-1733 [uncultured Arthrobacter sp.]
MWNPFRKKRRPEACEPEPAIPTPEAVREAMELHLHMRPRVERATQERDRLMAENHFAARIRAVYQGERAS